MVNGYTVLLSTLDFHTGHSILFTENVYYNKVEYSFNKIQVKHTSLLMSYVKWLGVTTLLYFCPKCPDTLAILLVLMLIGIK
jgi:hypothetical protein